jgi:hypothetical protein
MSRKMKSVPLNSKEATDYLSKLLGIPVTYGTPEDTTEVKLEMEEGE